MKKKMRLENLVGLSLQHVDITSVPDTHLTVLYFMEKKRDIFSAFSMWKPLGGENLTPSLLCGSH